jgi:hypothetical protein
MVPSPLTDDNEDYDEFDALMARVTMSDEEWQQELDTVGSPLGNITADEALSRLE